MNEEQVLKARLKDLAQKSYQQNIYTFSPFLSPAELATLDGMREELAFVDYSVYGGNEQCERQMVAFGSERMFSYEAVWPIRVIKIVPLLDKFSDELTHRDFLGALMNLGMERSVLGDILVKEHKYAFLFCADKVADYIVNHLTKIKHTNVRCIPVMAEDELEGLAPILEDMHVIVSAPRFDTIVAAVCKCSRSETVNLFRAGKVSRNGRMFQNYSAQLKDGDTFSVRGFGKYKYCGSGNETRKGRIYIHLQKFT